MVDVFRGDIIKCDGIYYAVIDSMQSNNGNFKARSKNNIMRWFNVVTDDIEIIQRAPKITGSFTKPLLYHD